MKHAINQTIHISLAAALLALSATALSAAESDDLAMQLVNPVAALISLPLQSNFDWGGGPNGDGFQYRINSQWTVPINLGVAQLLMIGGAPVQFQFGGRYYAETPDNGPDWGLRFTVTFLWPR